MKPEPSAASRQPEGKKLFGNAAGHQTQTASSAALAASAAHSRGACAGNFGDTCVSGPANMQRPRLRPSGQTRRALLSVLALAVSIVSHHISGVTAAAVSQLPVCNSNQ